MANFPTYISCDSQENYNIELIQTLTDNLSDNGWIVPQITTPNLNLISSGMPDGTLWYLTDSTPPSPVMKINGIIIPLSSGSVATSVTGTTDQINVSPTTGAVVVSLANNAILPGTGGVTLPQGNTAARAGGSGTIRFNSQTGVFESTSDGINWATIETSAIGVVSVSGTAGRITCSPTIGSVVVDIDSTYVGQTSITTLGTITSGTWNGSIIDLVHGGTNANLTASNGGIVWSNATQMQILSGTAIAKQVLLSGSGATPAWSTATYPATTTVNQILYSSATNTISGLPTATNGVLITDATVGIPSISSTLPATVQGNITTTGTITSGAWHGSIITGTYGGTGVNNGTSTITIGGNVTFSGAFIFTGTLSNNTAVTFPTTGTLATTAQLPAILNFSLVAQGAVPVQAPGTIKYESTTIYTSIVNGKNYAIGVGFIGSPTLTIWDISAPISPVLVGTFVAAGGGAYNCTIGVVGGVQYAFIGYNSGAHFVVVNLTNPAAPVQVSNTVITGTAGSIYGVSFLNGFVYCATQNIGLVVMDVGGGVGTPAAPVQTYTQGATKSFGVVAIGTNVYTTQYSTSLPFTIRQIISWTLTGAGTPSVPSLLQSLQVTSAGEALGLSVSGNTAFVTTAATGAYNIDLVDITTPTAMTNLSQINSTNTFNSAFFAVANGNYLYIPSGSNATYGGAIDAYDITVRTAPVHIAQVTTGQPNSVFGAIALSGGYIFCADYGTVANNGYFDVFTQINATAIFGQITTSTAYVNSLTPNTALVSSATDGIISSVTTATELSYVHGVTSSIQAQINALAGGFVYNQVAGTTQTLAVNNGYQANSAALTTLTLPTVAAFGTIIDIVGYGTGLFVIAQNAGQVIHSGNVDTTVGIGGSIASTYRYCSIQLLCSVANTEFTVLRQNGEFLIT